MRLPLGSWIWWKETRDADFVAGTTSTGMVTRASRMWPDQKARAAMGHLFSAENTRFLFGSTALERLKFPPALGIGDISFFALAKRRRSHYVPGSIQLKSGPPRPHKIRRNS